MTMQVVGSPTRMPEVSVVICTYNRADLLKQSLMSAVNQQFEGRCFEIIVSDDGSSDHTADTVASIRQNTFIEVRYIAQHNSGIGSARNQGFREARAPWVAYIDDDEVACETWLLELVRTATKSGADCIGGPSLLKVLGNADIEPVGTIAALLGQNPCIVVPDREMSLMARIRTRVTREQIPGGGNALIRKCLLERVGGFRPLHYGEDLDFFRRAAREGARFSVAHKAIIYHLTPVERLTPQYLYAQATRGGQSQASIDRDVAGTYRSYVMAALRLTHLVLITVPALLWYYAAGRRSDFISKCCSLRCSLAYIRATLGGFSV